MSKTLVASAIQHTAEYERSHYHVQVDDDVSIADVLVPAFWSNHTRALKRFDVIDVIRADGMFDITLRVTEVGIGYVKTRPLRIWEDPAAAVAAEEIAKAAAGGEANEPVPPEYKITPMGKGGFAVTFVPADAKIAQGKKTRGEAVLAAKEHAKNAGIAWPDAAPATPTPGD
jgi:hypothetical protein